MRLPDATADNWVDRRAPEALRPWLKLGRFDRPAGIWLLMLPGWQGIALASAAGGRWPDPWLLLLFAVGAAAMRAAGCAWNDLVDRDLDAQVTRTAGRPVASGRIGRRGAAAFAAGCTLVGAAVLLYLNWACFWLAVASLGLVALYPFMKRITWWPQAWLGLTFNWGALMGVAAAYPSSHRAYQALVEEQVQRMMARMPADLHDVSDTYLVDFSLQAFGVFAVLLYLSGVFWTLGYDTIYAAQDLEDDALVGVKSSTRRLRSAAPGAVAGFYFMTCGFAAWLGWYARLGPLFWAGLALFTLHLAWQARRFRLSDPAGALALFKSNRDAGLLLFLAIMAGLWRAGGML